MCSNAPDLKADSKSVRISEISQKLTEIATFFFQKGGKKAEKFFRFLDFGAISFEYRERRNENLEEMSKWTRLNKQSFKK